MTKMNTVIVIVAMGTLSCSDGTLSYTAATPTENADPCAGAGIIKIKRPIYPNKPNSPFFDYSFQLRSGTSPGAGTIIYIPGGPGELSIYPPGENVTSERSVIHTDPRGIGCNKIDVTDAYDSFITSENIAGDIVAIVDYLQLDHFVVYGTSYGTEVATIAAHMLDGIDRTPTAVVLEGILGKAFTGDRDPRTSFIQMWDQVRSGLSVEMQSELAKPSPYGVDGEHWAAWLPQQLSIRKFNMGDDGFGGSGWVNFPEFWLTKINDRAMSDFVKAMIGEAKIYDFDQYQAKLYKQIVCDELVPGGHEADFDFINGALVSKADETCSGIGLNHPYDSARYNIKAPTFYFEGELDPSTPNWQAEYHRSEKKNAKRYFVSVLGNGHASLSIGLDDCKEKIWPAIMMADGTRFRDALKSCSQKTLLSTFEPDNY